MKLDLHDLQPQESTLELSEKPGKKYALKKFSLASQVWLKARFPADKAKTIFEDQSLPEISEIAHYLLKDKTDFPTVTDLQEAVVTQQDRINLIQALLTTIGLSQPVIQKIAEQNEGNA